MRDDAETIRTILERTRTIAVLGAHWDPERPACYVPEYLHGAGYRVLPVNPAGVRRTAWSGAFVAELTSIAEPVDMVDVFRRSDLVAQHTTEILAMQPLPKVVWLQLGIRNDEVATTLEAAGITVIQDRCTLAEHRRLGLPARERP